MDTTNTVDSVLDRYGVSKITLPEGNPLRYSLYRLWVMFWGKAAPTAPIWNLEMLGNQLSYTKGKLVVLEQYPLVLDRLRAHRQSTVPIPFRGMLITGSPGIGKTCCLWYLLVVHLCNAEPVVLLYGDKLYVFTGLGPYALTKETAEVVETHHFRNVLCLVDMDAEGRSSWPVILSRESQCFTVAASSPQRGNYHNWVKQCRIATTVLDAPSNRDFRELLLQSVDKKTLNHLLDIFGPNIRALVPVIRNLSAVQLQTATELHVVAMKQHLEGLNKTQLEYLFTRPDSLSNPFSYTLVHTYGTKAVEPGDETILHRIRTPLVLRLLLQSFQQSRLAQLRDMYELFSASSHLSVSRRWAFEVLCHAKICELDELILHPLSVHKNKLKMAEGALPVHVSIGKRRMEIYGVGRAVETTVDTECYYVPAEGNNPTFDSFIPGEASLALQMLIGRTRTFKTEGVTMFRKRLRAFDTGRNWKINKMKFVFVVPTGYVFEVLPEVPRSRLRDIDFFVLELDVGKEYERFFYEDENCRDDSDDDSDYDDENCEGDDDDSDIHMDDEWWLD